MLMILDLLLLVLGCRMIVLVVLFPGRHRELLVNLNLTPITLRLSKKYIGDKRKDYKAH